jgi:hypothetical protein
MLTNNETITSEELNYSRILIAQSKNWTPAIEKHLRGWKKQIISRQKGHKKYASAYKFRYTALGVVSILIGAIISSSIFSTFKNCGCNGCPSTEWIRFTTGFLTLIYIFLSGLQTFLGYRDESSNHKSAADSYEELLRRIDELLRLPSHMRGETVSQLQSIRSKFDDISKNAPSLPSKYFIELSMDSGQVKPPKPEDVHLTIPTDTRDLVAILKDDKGSSTDFDLDSILPTNDTLTSVLQLELCRLHADSRRKIETDSGRSADRNISVARNDPENNSSERTDIP